MCITNQDVVVIRTSEVFDVDIGVADCLASTGETCQTCRQGGSNPSGRVFIGRRIASLPTVECICIQSAVEYVVATTPIKRVVPGSTPDEITAGTTGHDIVTVAGQDFNPHTGPGKHHQRFAGGAEHGVIVLGNSIAPGKVEVVDHLKGVGTSLAVDDHVGTKIDRCCAVVDVVNDGDIDTLEQHVCARSNVP